MNSNMSRKNRWINTRLGGARNSKLETQNSPPKISLVFRGFLGISLLSIMLLALPCYGIGNKKKLRNSRIIWRSTSSAFAA
jgi:hypothetical protein